MHGKGNTTIATYYRAFGAKETVFLSQDFQRMPETSKVHEFKSENILLPLRIHTKHPSYWSWMALPKL